MSNPWLTPPRLTEAATYLKGLGLNAPDAHPRQRSSRPALLDEAGVEIARLRAENERLLVKWSEADALWITAKAEVARLRQGLWDCAIAAGMDHDGDFTPEHLAHPDIVEVALREVRELHNDYDEALGGGRA